MAQEPPSGAAGADRQARLVALAQGGHRVSLRGPRFSFDIVGESYYQQALRGLDGGRLASGETVAFTALLIPAFENTYSKSGRAVLIAVEGVGAVGHLNEEDAIRYKAVSEKLHTDGAVGECDGWLIGGRGDAPTIGVRLNLKPPEEAMADLAHVSLIGL